MNPEQVLARYRRFRRICLHLGNKLLRRIPRDGLLQCGERIGILKGDIFVFETPDEALVLADYSIYNYR